MIIMTAEDTGILFIGHGSRLPYNKEVVTQVAPQGQNQPCTLHMSFSKNSYTTSFYR